MYLAILLIGMAGMDIDCPTPNTNRVGTCTYKLNTKGTGSSSAVKE